nr:Serine/threonine-protein kinase [Ipomoea batatas]
MASLTPGVLLKLLQNVDDKHAKVVGEHRSALLQVISIVPSLDDDPWKSRGFYLRVSDSEHSAYVSVSDEDAELILSDSVQLGQFIHVTRLDAGSPVPVLRGLKPVAKRRPCVGEPKDLISSDFLTVKSRRRHSVDAGKVEGMEMKRVSLDSMRRGWDPSPSGKNGSNSISKNNPLKSFSPDSVCSQKKVSLEKDLTPRRISMGASPLQNKNIIVSPKLVSKPSKKDVQTSQDDALPGHLMKVDVGLKNLSDSRVFWSSLPSPIHCLGKEVMVHRNTAFCSAMQALEEASAAEGIIHCMRLEHNSQLSDVLSILGIMFLTFLVASPSHIAGMFAELCELSDRCSAGQVVERFLHLQERMQNAFAVIYALMNRRALETKTKDGFSLQYSLPEMCKNAVNKNAALWVQAAVDTNLSRLCLFSNQQKGGIISNGEKHYCAIIENSPKKTESENLSPKDRKSPRNHGADLPNSNTKGQPSRPRRSISAAQNTDVGTQVWSKGDGLKDAATLAEKLLSNSRTWFLNYLETNLDVAFGMQKGEGNPEIVRLLGQLKRVNQWLDNSRQEGDKPDENPPTFSGLHISVEVLTSLSNNGLPETGRRRCIGKTAESLVSTVPQEIKFRKMLEPPAPELFRLLPNVVESEVVERGVPPFFSSSPSSPRFFFANSERRDEDFSPAAASLRLPPCISSSSSSSFAGSGAGESSVKVEVSEPNTGDSSSISEDVFLDSSEGVVGD